MTIIDDINREVPTYIKIIQLVFTQEDGAGIIAKWDVNLYGPEQNEIAIVNTEEDPPQAVKDVIIAYYQNRLATLLAASGLEELPG